MDRSLPTLNTSLASQPSPAHRAQLRLGITIEIFTVIWMLIEATIALTTGFVTNSVSLESFGIDSIIELLAGGILLWRLLVEQRGAAEERVERAERIASWVTAISLFTLAGYIIADGGWTFVAHIHPVASWWGVGLAIAAAIVMPLLWQAKLRVARRIGSPALKADAACSVTCAYMSLTLLIGLLLNRLLGWWWADPLAAFALLAFLLKEGREALHEARTGETCHCGDDAH